MYFFRYNFLDVLVLDNDDINDDIGIIIRNSYDDTKKLKIMTTKLVYYYHPKFREESRNENRKVNDLHKMHTKKCLLLHHLVLLVLLVPVEQEEILIQRMEEEEIIRKITILKDQEEIITKIMIIKEEEEIIVIMILKAEKEIITKIIIKAEKEIIVIIRTIIIRNNEKEKVLLWITFLWI